LSRARVIFIGMTVMSR